MDIEHETIMHLIKNNLAESLNLEGLPAHMIALTEGVKLQSIEGYQSAPSSQKKRLTFLNKDSFLTYYKEHETEETRLYYKKESGAISVRAIFDSHTKGSPSHERHTADLLMPFHEDYEILRANSGHHFRQTEFAEYCEEISHLFAAPDAATILEIGQELKGSSRAEFKAGKRLSNGQVSLEYTETIDAKTSRGDIVVPEVIVFLTPIYEGGEPQEIPAAFRWRLKDRESGTITLHYKLMTLVEERIAQEKIVADVRVETGKPILLVNNFDF